MFSTSTYAWNLSFNKFGGGEYILMLSSILHQSPKWDIWKENLIVNLNHYTLYPNGAHPRNASVI